ncbi:MAG: hypothetical protein MUO31_07125 [Thermodesulfovibrionales bacterium]|nr:hypothetical protein [Thermodesulfovibrionales bacterium]
MEAFEVTVRISSIYFSNFLHPLIINDIKVALSISNPHLVSYTIQSLKLVLNGVHSFAVAVILPVKLIDTKEIEDYQPPAKRVCYHPPTVDINIQINDNGYKFGGDDASKSPDHKSGNTATAVVSDASVLHTADGGRSGVVHATGRRKC